MSSVSAFFFRAGGRGEGGEWAGVGKQRKGKETFSNGLSLLLWVGKITEREGKPILGCGDTRLGGRDPHAM